MNSIKKIAFGLLVASLVAGCSSNGGDNKSDTGQSKQDAHQTADAAEDTATAQDTATEPDVASDTETVDMMSTDGFSSNPIVYFEYRQAGQSGHSNEVGISVSLGPNNERITKIDATSPSKPLKAKDVQMLKTQVLTTKIYDKMKNESWKCGSVEKYQGARHEFEAKLGTQLSAPEPITIISGCIAMDSMKEDADLVQKTITELEKLRDSYFGTN